MSLSTGSAGQREPLRNQSRNWRPNSTRKPAPSQTLLRLKVSICIFSIAKKMLCCCLYIFADYARFNRISSVSTDFFAKFPKETAHDILYIFFRGSIIKSDLLSVYALMVFESIMVSFCEPRHFNCRDGEVLYS
jgi:hypothetical protein